MEYKSSSPPSGRQMERHCSYGPTVEPKAEHEHLSLKSGGGGGGEGGRGGGGGNTENVYTTLLVVCIHK